VATSALVRRRAPLLAEAASLVGYPAIRRRGTIGGSLAHADPVAELPCAALALDAEFDVVGPQGRRTIAARDFFVTYFTPALDPAEVVTEIRFAAAGDGERWSFLEFARKTGDFAVAAVAVRLPVAGGVVAGARVALAGVADRPLRAAAAEMALEGRPIDALEPDAVVSAVLEDLHEAGADERRVAGVLARRALAEAIERTEEAR
jgi:carbon-monoxide dehydrogenase medium subunit